MTEAGQKNVIDMITGANQRRHRESFAAIDQLRHMEMGELMMKNQQRYNAAVDAHWKCRYGDNINLPESDEDGEMGARILNSTFIGSDALAELGKLLEENPDRAKVLSTTAISDASIAAAAGVATAQAEAQASVPEEQPTTQPIEPDSTPELPAQQASKGWSKLAKGAAIAAGVGLAAIGGGLISNYLNDDLDTRNVYDIIAEEYIPEPTE